MLKQSTFAFTYQHQSGQFSVYRLDQIVKTYFSASNSVILALAAYITWKFPYMPHPDYLNYQIGQLCMEQQFPSVDLSLHPLFEAWSDILCRSVFEGNAIRINETLYCTIPVTEHYTKILQQFNWKHQSFQQKQDINKIFNLPKIIKKQKKILLMNFATSQLRQNQLLPKINIPALLMGTIFDNQQWTIYQALKGKIPTKQDIVKADAIILPGSSNSVLDVNQNVDVFVGRLKQAYAQNTKLKILSICYGHQLIARIYGAKIVRKTRFQGHETVAFDKNLTKKYSFLYKISQYISDQFLMPEHHEDYVETVPKDFDLIATSNSCLVQAMMKKDGRIFSLQFHPQYFTQYTSAFTARAKMANIHSHHFSFDLDVQPNKLNAHHQSCIFVRECIKQFLASQTVVTDQL